MAHWMNLLLIILIVFVIWRISMHPRISAHLTRYLRRRVIRTEMFQRVTVEELLLTTGGYGVARVAVQAGSPVLDKTLAQSGLRSYDITVLGIVREGQTIANPPASTTILQGDELICFGKLGNIRSQILMNP
jgi:K+/H+ antiporter YhaU regulatory subunit KhtT